MEKELQPISLFDVDHTLSEDSFTVLDFADFLDRKNLFQKHGLEVMIADYDAFIHRITPMSYRDFATSIVDHFSAGLKDFRRKNIFDAGKCFFPSVYLRRLQRLRRFSVDVVAILNGVGVETMIVSGAPKEVALPLAKFLEIRRTFPLEAGLKSGFYTGRTKINMALDDEKEKVVKKLQTSGYKRELSFAFGDNVEHDKPILEAVGNPFFVLCNHNLEQETTALNYGWTIVDESNILTMVKQRLASLGRSFPSFG